jgi:methionine biosynthesis protein MetW
MKREEIYRDTKNWYLKNEKNQAYSKFIDLTAIYAGDKILDVGCATGDYCIKLKKLGFECVGIDINQDYVEKARENGIEAHKMDANDLGFHDNSFDTLLLFEVLEHVRNPERVLDEAKRVARKNILISVPNCTSFFELKKCHLTYEHMLERDHVNFFTKKDLEKLLSKKFSNFKVKEIDPINNLIGLSTSLNYLVKGLIKLKLTKYDKIYSKIISIIEV